MASLERFLRPSTDLSEENSVEINRVLTGHTPGEEISFLCRGDERGGGSAVQLYEGSVMRERMRGILSQLMKPKLLGLKTVRSGYLALPTLLVARQE